MLADLPKPPSRLVSVGLSVLLVAGWAAVRLVVFDDTLFPLTYAIPLLVCVWTRDRLALWGMAAVFLAMHAGKLVLLGDDATISLEAAATSMLATTANVLIAAGAVHAIIGLRDRLEGALTEVSAQADELRAQSEELAQQNEELAEQADELLRQTEELSQQGEELANQNEELQTQSEQISTLNVELEGRGRLLVSLLDTARRSESEQTALQHIADATQGLFADLPVATAIYEQTADGLRRCAFACEHVHPADTGTTPVDSFAALVIGQARTAALDDAALRPDLALPRIVGPERLQAALGAPIQAGDAVSGAFVVYGKRKPRG